MSEEPTKSTRWFDKPFIGQYSLLDFSRTGIALAFIFLCMTFLTLYVHHQVEETAEIKAGVRVEYVNMTREDVYNNAGTLILQAPDMVIDKILEFPVSYDKLGMQGYIILDTVTGVRYMWIRNEFGVAITKYWTWEEAQWFKEHIQLPADHEYKDLSKDRPTRFGPDSDGE